MKGAFTMLKSLPTLLTYRETEKFSCFVLSRACLFLVNKIKRKHPLLLIAKFAENIPHGIWNYKGKVLLLQAELFASKTEQDEAIVASVSTFDTH